MEVWKDIAGYEGLYQVSNFGRIKSFYTGRIMRLAPAKNGYLVVNLTKSGKQKVYSVHRLVAGTFLAPDSHKTFVNHKNGNKHDNRLDNLEWCTKSENAVHSLYKLKNHHGAVFTRSVRCVETDEVFPSSVAAAKGDATLARYIRASAAHRKYYETADGRHWEWA